MKGGRDGVRVRTASALALITRLYARLLMRVRTFAQCEATHERVRMLRRRAFARAGENRSPGASRGWLGFGFFFAVLGGFAVACWCCCCRIRRRGAACDGSWRACRNQEAPKRHWFGRVTGVGWRWTVTMLAKGGVKEMDWCNGLPVLMPISAMAMPVSGSGDPHSRSARQQRRSRTRKSACGRAHTPAALFFPCGSSL